MQNEVSCWIEENAGRASYLLLYSIIYTEEHMTQFLDRLLIALYRALMERSSKTVMINIPLSLKYIARYCNPSTYSPLVIQAIRNELAAFYSFTQAGSIKAFGHIFEGAIEILPDTADLNRIAGLLHEFIDAVKSVVIDGLDIELAQIMIDTIYIVLEALIRKHESGVSVKKFLAPYLYDIFNILLRSHGVLLNFKILGKTEPSNIAESKIKIRNAFEKLAALSERSELDFVDENLPRIISEAFSRSNEEDLSCISLQSMECRIIYTVFEHLNAHRSTL